MSRRSPPLSKLSFDSQHQNAFRLVSLQLHQTSNTRSAFHHQVLPNSPQPKLRVRLTRSTDYPDRFRSALPT